MIPILSKENHKKSYFANVHVRFNLSVNTKLIKAINFDNRCFNIEEHVEIDRNGKKIQIIPDLKSSCTNLDQGYINQSFLIEDTLITREFRFYEPEEDFRGTKFEIIVKLPKKTDFNLKWGLKIKNPDYIYGNLDTNTSGQIFLKEGNLNLSSKQVNFLRIDEIDGCTLLVPMFRGHKKTQFSYHFKKGDGLFIYEERKSSASIGNITFPGYISLARRDEPIADGSLILVNSCDWKIMTKSLARPTNTKNLRSTLNDYSPFSFSNQFPVIFTEKDSLHHLKEFLKIGQASNTFITHNVKNNCKIRRSEIFSKAVKINPAYRMFKSDSKFRFLFLLPDNIALTASLALLIRDYNVLPIFRDDFNEENILDSIDRCEERSIFAINFNFHQNEYLLLDRLNIKIISMNLGDNQKASLKVVKAYLFLKIVDKMKRNLSIFSQITAPVKIAENGKRLSIEKLINEEFQKQKLVIEHLLNLKSYSGFLRKILEKDYYSEVEDLENFLVGLDGISFKSSLNYEESKSPSTLRRIGFVTNGIKANNFLSIIQYSLAFDTPMLIIDEKKYTNTHRKTIERILKAIEKNESISKYSLALSEKLKEIPGYRFVQKWNNKQFQLYYSSIILEKISLKLPYSKKDIQKKVFSTKGVVSIFLENEFPIEFGLGNKGFSNLVFGRFFLTESNIFRHQVLSAIANPRRSHNTKMNFSVITVEKDTKLIYFNKKIQEILKCNGNTLGHDGKISKEEIEESLKETDMTFIFIHGSIDKINPNPFDPIAFINSTDFDEEKLYRGVLILNSCKTGEDIAGKKLGIASKLSKLGIPLIIAPLTDISERTAGLFSASMASKIHHRVPISQIVSLIKRESINANKTVSCSYFLFGSPYTRFFNPLPDDFAIVDKCIVKAAEPILNLLKKEV